MRVSRARDTWLEVALDCAAAYRLTKLLTDDVVTQAARSRFVQAAYVGAGQEGRARAAMREAGYDRDEWDRYARDDPDAPKLATLATCRWCAGMYVAGAVTAARLLWPAGWRWAARGLTAAAASALLAGLEDD